MLIFVLEGVHGAGKTTLLEYFEKFLVANGKRRRVPCLPEGFLTTFQATDFAKTGLLGTTSHEMGYLAFWLYNVRRFISQHPEADCILVDRSLLSTAIYAEDEIDGDRIMKLIPKLHNDLAKEGHTVITIYLRRNLDDLLRMIHKRLSEDPDRLTAAREMDEQHLKETFDKYEEYIQWDCVIDVKSGLPITQPWRCVICNEPGKDMESSLASLCHSLYWEIDGWALMLRVDGWNSDHMPPIEEEESGRAGSDKKEE